MKQIKFLIAIALVSVIAISCKETPKEEVVAPVEEVTPVEEVAPVVDSTAVEATVEEVEAPAAE